MAKREKKSKNKYTSYLVIKNRQPSYARDGKSQDFCARREKHQIYFLMHQKDQLRTCSQMIRAMFWHFPTDWIRKSDAVHHSRRCCNPAFDAMGTVWLQMHRREWECSMCRGVAWALLHLACLLLSIWNWMLDKTLRGRWNMRRIFLCYWQ